MHKKTEMDFCRSFSQLKFSSLWNFACLLWFCKTCLSLCPADIQTYASDCFGGYNAQLRHIQNTDRTLFSGVDVENLRQLCSLYKTAISCIQSIQIDCPPERQKQLDLTKIVSFDGSHIDVSDICKDDSMLEVYARNQFCFISHGQYSEKCFQREMGLNISSIKDVSKKPLNTFCSEMKKFDACVSTNIMLECGKEAESLVDKLIKATIKRSRECDKTVPISQTSSSGTNNQNRNGQNGANSGNSFVKNCSLYTTLLMCLIFLVLKHSIRL